MINSNSTIKAVGQIMTQFLEGMFSASKNIKIRVQGQYYEITNQQCCLTDMNAFKITSLGEGECTLSHFQVCI